VRGEGDREGRNTREIKTQKPKKKKEEKRKVEVPDWPVENEIVSDSTALLHTGS
jgi:hypothetical protein